MELPRLPTFVSNMLLYYKVDRNTITSEYSFFLSINTIDEAKIITWLYLIWKSRQPQFSDGRRPVIIVNFRELRVQVLNDFGGVAAVR